MYNHILILPDGTQIASGTGAAIKSVTLTQTVNSGEDLILGSCCSDMLEAVLFAPGGRPEIRAGDAVTLYKESETGRKKLGVFTVEAPTRPTPNTLKITGYDAASKLDKDLTYWLSTLTGWPYALEEFAAMVCAACGLTYVSAPIVNAGFPVQKWSAAAVTGRRIMRWLGEIACRFVHADPDGNIAFGWYEGSGKTLCAAGEGYYFAGTLSYEAYQVAPMDAVQLRLSDGSLYGAGGSNPYIIAGNPIFTVCPEEIWLENIRQGLSSVSYTPCKVAFPADPALTAGSILTLRDPNGKELTAYVMEKVSSGQRDSVTCTGNPRRDSTASYYTQTASQKSAAAQAQTVAAITRQDIVDRLTNYGQIQGISTQDGKWHIDAALITLVNLIAERLCSQGEDTALDIDHAALILSYTHPEQGVQSLFTLSAVDGQPALTLGGETKTLAWRASGDGTFALVGIQGGTNESDS